MNAQQQSARLRPFRPVPFGRYTLLTPLSMGGMGEIFLARLEGAQGFEKLCVIKKILPAFAQDTEFVERFVNEARVLVKLSHGSIAQVLDVGLFEGDPYIALEYVEGKDLRRVLARARDRGSPLPLSFALYVVGRVLDALAYAHRKRDEEDRELHLVHRDISPQNILISYEGEVKVIDFGLAKSSLSASNTNPSLILGKFLYMSPEQARQQKVDHRTDLYAVGLCLYELVSGRNPFDHGPPNDVIERVMNPYIAPLEALVPQVPRAVQEMVTRALELDPERRFQTAEEFRGSVQACLMELDPTAGPESVSSYMLEAFGADHQQERKLLASLRTVVRPVEDDPELEERKRIPGQTDTAVVSVHDVAPNTEAARTLLEVPSTPQYGTGTTSSSLADIQPAPLSFAPTPRLDESPSRRQTLEALPTVRVAAASGVGFDPRTGTLGDETQPGLVVASILGDEAARSAPPKSPVLRISVAAALIAIAGVLVWTCGALSPGEAEAEAEPEAERGAAALVLEEAPATAAGDGTQLLTPLTGTTDLVIEAKPATVSTQRAHGPGSARQVRALWTEWRKVKGSFNRIKGRYGCSASGMRPLCEQAVSIEADLKKLDTADEERIASARRVVEAFRGEVAQISRKGIKR